MDPALWSGVSDAIAQALLTAAPDLPVQANLDPFKSELASLRAYADEVLATVPEESRVLVSAHDAFGYFGRAWGFEPQGIQGISTESEAGVARIEELVSLLVDRRVAAVFVESSVSDRGLRALVEGAAARGHEVAIGGQLFSDAMGPEGTYEGTYLGMIDHNVTTIARALGGTAPERGRLGLLGAGA
jgi:manganese/zinc/iron transport system substrate-binding protein